MDLFHHWMIKLDHTSQLFHPSVSLVLTQMERLPLLQSSTSSPTHFHCISESHDEHIMDMYIL